MNRAYQVLLVLAFWLDGCTKPSSINGKVVDGFGNPVQGATVKVEGTQFVAQTDHEGEYSVRYVPGDITVKISKPGYTESFFAVKIATESIFPAEDKTLYQIPKERGIWYMDFDTKQYVPIRTSAVKADETVTPGSWNRQWHKSYTVQLFDDNHTVIRVPDGSALRFVDSDGVDQKLIQLDNMTEGFWSLLEKSWSDSGRPATRRVSLLGEADSVVGNGLILRSTNLAAGNVYGFANLTIGNWGGEDISGLVYLFTIEKK